MSILITNRSTSSAPSTPAMTFSVSTSTSTGSSTTPLIYTNIINDSNSGYNITDGRYTIPVGGSGMWHFSSTMYLGPSSADLDLYQNGVQVAQGTNSIVSEVAVLSADFVVAVGDIIDIRPGSAGGTASGPSYINMFSGFLIK